MPKGKQGTGLTTATAFSVPPESLGWWQRRLAGPGTAVGGPRDRDGEEVLTFRDPDGLVIELVASAGDARSGRDGVARVPTQHAVRGLYSVTMSERMLDPTAQVLAGMLGKRVLVANGRRDPMVTAAQTDALVTPLHTRGTEVVVLPHDGGHTVDPQQLPRIAGFLQASTPGR